MVYGPNGLVHAVLLDDPDKNEHLVCPFGDLPPDEEETDIAIKQQCIAFMQSSIALFRSHCREAEGP